MFQHGNLIHILRLNCVALIGECEFEDLRDVFHALTERSLLEAAEVAGIRTVDLVTRFLPYSTKGRLPADRRLVRAYLRLRPAWLLFGRQTLFVGEPT